MKKYALLVAVGITVLSALAEESKNMVNNPGFEQGMPSYMEKRGSVVLDYDIANDANEGLISLKLDASKGKNYSGISTIPMPVTAGKRYRLSCYIKNDKTIDGNGFYIVILQEKPGKVLGWWPRGGKSTRTLLVTKEATNGWVKKEVVLDGFIPGTSKVKLYFRLKGKGIVNIDDISLEEIKMPETLVDDFSSDSWGLMLGKEFRGAKGSKALGQTEFKSEPSAMCVDYDFSGGGRYVGIRRNINIPEKVKMISFQTKVSAENPVFVTMIDAKKQYHRSGNVALKKVDTWQEVTFALNKKSLRHAWGGGKGIKKGKIYFPIKTIWICTHINGKKAKAEGKESQKGKLYIDDLKFYTLGEEK